MNWLSALKRGWNDDALLRKIVKNSGYLLSGNVAAMVLSMGQSILAGRLLGVVGFGVVGTITAFATMLNRLTSFRMNELVVKYYGEARQQGNLQRAGAIIKAAALAEATSSVISFLLLVFIAPLAAARLADDPSIAWLFRTYGLVILTNLIFESSQGVLQVDGKFRSQAVLTLAGSLITAGIIVVAFLTKGDLTLVVLAYLLGKTLHSLGTIYLAADNLRKQLGSGWLKNSPFASLPPIKELTSFAISTNLSSTIILLVRDNEVIWAAYFLSPLESGYVKTALAIINLVQMPITPFISTTYPEINAAISVKDWNLVRRLLKRITLISAGWTVGTGIGIVIFGRWLLSIYGSGFEPAYVPMLLFLAGFGFANIFFWNRPLLLSLGLPLVPYHISLWCGIAKLALAFLLVPRFGINMEAFLLSAFFIVSVTLIITRGFREISQQEKLQPEST